MTKSISICFVALNSYSLFNRSKNASHVGGAEAQQFEMARYLRDQGHRVSFVVKDHGQPRYLEHDGIGVYSAYDPDAGIPGLRFFLPRWSGLAAAMKAADAQIYYQRAAGAETGQVALWCSLRNRRFIYGVASGGDCDAQLPAIDRALDRCLYRHGLASADRIVAQTTHQQQMLGSNFELNATVIPNVIRSPGVGDTAVSRRQQSLLWVGRVAPIKRVEWLVAIAQAQPDYEFRLVCGINHKTGYATRLVNQLKELGNVELIESMSRTELFSEYQRATALILTSKVEGFPNVFIEAWLAGTPVLTSFDPDDLVESNQLGWVARTQQGMIDQLAAGLFQSKAEEDAARERVMQYAQENHAPEVILPRFEALLRSL